MNFSLNCLLIPLRLSNLLCVIDLLLFRQVKGKAKTKQKQDKECIYVIPQVFRKMRKVINFVLNIPIKYPLTAIFNSNGYFYTHSSYKLLIDNNL